MCTPPDHTLRFARARRLVFCLLAPATALGLLAVGASAADVLPMSPVNLNATTAHRGLQVRPAQIIYTGDGTGVLSGAHVREHSSRIHWNRWTTHEALGTGFDQLNDCKPSCAGGRFRGYPVRLEMWRPQTLGGHRVFTRLTIFYEGRVPAGEPRHYTFTDTYLHSRGGGYGWGPPSAQGYCVHTYGLKPERDCRNIHSLPSD